MYSAEGVVSESTGPCHRLGAMNAHGESVWKLCLGVLVLLFFLGIGIGHLLDPNRFTKGTYLRRSGRVLSNSEGFQVRFVGLVVIVFSGYVLYQLAHDVLSR
jgi:hypothetical protein